MNYFEKVGDEVAKSIKSSVQPVGDLSLQQQSKVNQQYGSVVLLSDADYSDRFSSVNNLATNTENIAWQYYVASGTSTKTGVTKTAIINNKPVTLAEVSITGSQSLAIRFPAAGLTPFVPGKQYLLSFYVWSATEQWFWCRQEITENGYGVKWVPANQLTRVWSTFKAITSSTTDQGLDPKVPLGGSDAKEFIVLAPSSGANPNLFIGGIQIEGVSTNYKGGIIQIGDSTIQGNQGTNDLRRDYRTMNGRQISNVLGALLRINVFNRGVGGQRLDNMDARWATDITPLKVNAREVHIQGGINDIAQGTRTLSQMQASVQSMVSKAIADGLEYKIYTCTPTDEIGSSPSKEQLRRDFNMWIKNTYGERVLDIASVVEDPENLGFLKTEFWGDGTHYPSIAKMSIARYIASYEEKFSWIRKPLDYYPVST